MKWTPEEDAVLLKMLGEGKTAKVVAEALGRPRNAVIGRSHRLRDAGKPTPQGGRKVTIPKPKPKPKPKKGAVFLTCSESPPSLAQSLLELRHDQCRWPLETTFCEEIRQEGRAYCAAHRKISFRPVPGALK